MVRLLLLMVLAIALPFSAPARAEDRALIVGVDRYPHLGPEHRLTAAVNDARLMARLARKVWGFAPGQIKVLTDEAATAAGILAAIDDWLVAGTAPGDRVLLTYAGHGYYERDTSGDEPDGFDETLAPHDLRAQGGRFANMISDDQIGRRLDRLAGRDVMLVIDSCYSGTITRALDPGASSGPSVVRSPVAPARTRSLARRRYRALRGEAFLRSREGVTVWTAASATELSQEDMRQPPGRRNGVFTGALGRALLDRAGDANANGVVTAAELLTHLRTETARYCHAQACKTGMTPTLEVPDAAGLARDLLAWGGAPATSLAPGADGTGPGDADDGVSAAGNADAPSSAVMIPAATDLIPQVDRVGVDLTLVSPASAHVGQTLALRVRTTRPGYLILLDVSETGEVIQLFPSTLCARPDRRLRAGAAFRVPDPLYGCRFAATEPGRGQIMAIVTGDNVPLDDLLGRHRDLTVEPAGADYLAQIAQHLLSVWTADDRNRPVRWGLATVDYEVRAKE